MAEHCRKGLGTKEKQYNDRCYWLYNGGCIRPKGELCFYSLGRNMKKKKED